MALPTNVSETKVYTHPYVLYVTLYNMNDAVNVTHLTVAAEHALAMCTSPIHTVTDEVVNTIHRVLPVLQHIYILQQPLLNTQQPLLYTATPTVHSNPCCTQQPLLYTQHHRRNTTYIPLVKHSLLTNIFIYSHKSAVFFKTMFVYQQSTNASMAFLAYCSEVRKSIFLQGRIKKQKVNKQKLSPLWKVWWEKDVD